MIGDVSGFAIDRTLSMLPGFEQESTEVGQRLPLVHKCSLYPRAKRRCVAVLAG